MGLIISMLVIALSFVVLAIITVIALYELKPILKKLDKISPTGVIVNGKARGLESTLFKTLKYTVITGIIGFLLAAMAAISSIIYTPQ